jgi:hypothetical protein
MRFSRVLGIDNTYKTNWFKMPLFQVTGITDQQSVAVFAFGVTHNEQEDSYMWLCDNPNALRGSLSIPAPGVIITDKEAALKNALKDTFLIAQQ